MKKLIMLSAIVMSGLVYTNANAQFGIRVGFHIGARPVYAPAPVVREEPVYQEDQPVSYDDDYYYLPDVGAYYSVAEQCYYYNDGDNWISAAYLPGEYRNYDWRSARHYEVRARRPFMHDEVYRSRYNGFAGRRDWNHFEGRSNYGYANVDRFNHNGYHTSGERFDNHAFQGPHFDRGHDGFDGRQQYQNHGFDRGNQFNGSQQNQNHGFDRGNQNAGQQNQNQNHGFDRGNQNGGQQNQNHGFDRGNQNGGQQNQNHGFDRGNQNGGQQNQNHGGHDDRGNNGRRGF